MACLLAVLLQDLESVRQAFEQERDEDVVALTDKLTAPPEQRADLYFLRGASLNRLGRHADALESFDACDLDAPEVHLERGRALIGLGRWDEARVELDVVEGLSEDVELERARIDLETGQAGAARERLKGLTGGRYGAPAAQMLEEMDRTLEVHVRPLFGYDSNLLGVAQDAPLARERARESLYVGASGDARFWIIHPDPWALAAELQGQYRYYERASESSYLDETLSLSCWGPVDPDISIGATVSWGEAWTHGDGHFRTMLGGGGGARFRQSPGWETDVYATVAAFHFYTDAPDPQDRDGLTRQVGATQSMDLGGGWKLAPTAGVFDYLSEGSDFDHRGWQLGASLSPPELAGFQLTLSVNYASIRYRNANSLSTTGRRREDNLYTASLTIARRFEALDWTPSVTIGFTEWDSNIGPFDFDRWDVSFGLGLETKF